MLSGHERGLLYNVLVGAAVVDYDNVDGWAVINGTFPSAAISAETVGYFKRILTVAGILDSTNPYVVKPTELANIENSRFYVGVEACPTCGGLNLRRVETDECLSCKLKPISPRQQAIKDGKLWYRPAKPCAICQTYSERRVNNGECQECTRRTSGSKDGRATPGSELMRSQPDTILTKKQAKFMGIKVYRTGRPCRNGHTGWRYVSTNSCIGCLRSK